MKKLYSLLFFIFIAALYGFSQPIVLNLYPDVAGTDVALDSVIIIEFDRKVEPLANGGSIYIRLNSDSSAVEAFLSESELTFSADSMSVSFQSDSLIAQETYSIIIPDTIFREKGTSSTFPGILTLEGWSFTTGGPVLQTLYPSNGSINITKDSTLVIKFNKTVLASNDGDIYIVNTNDTSDVFQSIPIGSVDFSNGDSVIINANTFLDDSTYSIIIPDSVIVDGSGNFFGGLNTLTDWSFTIGDFTGPSVLAVYPSTGSSGIINDTILSVKFDETVVKASSGSVEIVLFSDSSSFQSIPIGDGAINIVGDSVTISHSLLNDLTQYSIIIPSGSFEDVSGNPADGISTKAYWNFTTGDFTAPSISNVEIDIYRTDSIDLSYQFGETGRLYYAISDNASFTTDSTVVKNGTGSPIVSGDTAVSTTSIESIYIDLTAASLSNIPYYIYLVSEDAGGNLGAVQKYSWTADNVSPTLSNDSARAFSNTGVIIEYQSSELGSLYYSIQNSWVGFDSVEVRDAVGVGSGDISITSTLLVNDTITGLSFDHGLEYYIYFTVEDSAHNLSAVDSVAWIADGTGPSLINLSIFDANFDGLIDSVILGFNEFVHVVDGSPDISDLGTLIMPDDSTVFSIGSISNPAGLTDKVYVGGIVAHNVPAEAIPNTAAGNTNIDFINGLWADNAGNVLNGDDSEVVLDSAGPVIASSFISIDNQYMDIVFSEDVYAIGSTPISDTVGNELDIAFVDDGDGTTLTDVDLTLNTGAIISAGTDTIRFNLTLGGTDPNNGETLEITPVDEMSVYDVYGNPMDTSVSSGLVYLNDANGSIAKTATITSLSSTYVTDPDDVDNGIVFDFEIANPFTASSDNMTFTKIVFKKGAGNTVDDWRTIMAGSQLEHTDDNSKVQNGMVYKDSIVFSGISTSPNALGWINDGSPGNPNEQGYQLKVWLRTDIADSVNLDDMALQFSVSATDMVFTSGNVKLEANSFEFSDVVDVEVVATEFRVLQTQPIQFNYSNNNVVTLVGTDANGNFDLGYTSSDSAIVAGQSLAPTAVLSGDLEVSFINDTASFTDLFIDVLGTGQIIRFTHTGFSNLDVFVDVVDVSGPAIVTTVPAKAATNVALTDTLIMDLDENAYIETGKIYLVRDAVPPTVTEIDVTDTDQVWVSNDSLFIAPTDPLVGSSDYYILADTAIISDVLGNLFDGILSDTVWYFTTTTSDLVRPSLTITRNAPSAGTVNATNVDSVTFALKFNEQINLASFTTADINVNVSGSLSALGGPTIISSSDKKNFTVTVSQITGDGYLDIAVGPTITDLAANEMSSAVTSSAFKIDRVAPLADSVSISSNNSTFTYDSIATTGNTVSLFMRFNEPIGALPSVSFRSGGVAVVNSAVVTQGATDSTFTATYNVNASDVQGEVTFSITFTDSATNVSAPHTTTTNGTVMYMDRTAPSVTLTTSEPSTTGTDPFDILATFSEGVIGGDVAIGDFAVTTLNAVITAVVPVAATSNQFTVTVDPADSITIAQTLSVQMSAGTVRDSVGLNNTASNVLTLTFDDIPPVISDSVIALTTTSIKIIDTLDQAGKIYYVLLPNGTTAPDSTEVKAGLDGDGAAALRKGSTSTGTVFDFNIASLSASSSYDLYQVAEDAVGNLSSVDSVVDVRTVPEAPGLTEIVSGTVGTSGGDTKTDVAMYRTANLPNVKRPNAPSGQTPVTIRPTFDGDSIIIYSDANLTQEAYRDIVPLSATGIEPTLANFFATNAFVDFTDSNDDNGLYTFYITQKSNGATSGQSAAAKYSIAFLDDIASSAGTTITVYSNDDEDGTVLGIGNHPSTDQEVTFSGDGLSGFDYNYTVGDTSYVNFIPADADPGPVQLTIRWFNSLSNVSATFIPSDIYFTVNAVSSVFATAGAIPYCKVDTESALPLNNDPDGVDTEQDTIDLTYDPSNPDFHTVEVYYQRNGNVDNTVGAIGTFNISGGNIADDLLTYKGAQVSVAIQDYGTAHSTTDWTFDPSALYSVPGLVTQDVDTLIFVTVVSADADSSFTVLGTERVYLFPDPTVSITNVNPYYCEDDGAFELEMSQVDYTGATPITGTINSGGYTLQYFPNDPDNPADMAYSVPRSSTFFDPSDPDGDGDDYTVEAGPNKERGFYKIIYESAASASGGCTGLDTVVFEILSKPDLPTVNLTGYDEIGGPPDGSGYLFEYKGGDSILNITLNIAGLDTAIWYLDGSGSNRVDMANVEGTQGEILNVLDQFFGGQIPSSNLTKNVWVSTILHKNYNGSDYEGCESELRHITIKTYAIPNAITVLDTIDADTTNQTNLGTFNVTNASSNVSVSGYVFEYCVDGGAASLDSIIIGSKLNSVEPTESYFTLYSKDFSVLKIFDVNDMNGSDPNDTLKFDLNDHFLVSINQKDTFYISRTDYDNNYPAASGAPFGGCESDLRMFTISVYDIPDAPLASSFKGGENAASRQAVGSAGADTIRYYFCFGDGSDFAQIDAPGIQGSEYKWYTNSIGLNVPEFPIGAEASNGRFITIDELVSGGGLDTTNAGTTTFWVTETRNSTTLNTDFEGCESPATRVEITVFPDPDPVLFEDGMGGNQYYSVSACIDQIGSTSITGIGLTNSTFKWYLSNEDSTLESTSPVFTQLYTNTNSINFGTSTVTGANLQLTTVNKDSTMYFRVSQTNSIRPNSSSFLGCESEVDNMGYLTFHIYGIPEVPVTGGLGSSGDTTMFNMDSVSVYGIDIHGEGNLGELISWYEDFDDDGDADGPAIYTSESLADDQISNVSLSDLGLSLQNENRIYKYLVTQTQDIDGVSGFEGCESPYLTVYIFEAPSVPIDIAVNTQCNFAVTNNSTVIEFRGQSDTTAFDDIEGRSFFKLYNENLEFVEQTNVFPQPDSVNEYIIDITAFVNANGFGDTTIYLSQVNHNNVRIGSETFEGVEGAKVEYTITVYPRPEIPVITGNISPNLYEYCEGLVPGLEKLDVDVVNPGATYNWYAKLSDVGEDTIMTGQSIPLDSINGREIGGGFFDLSASVNNFVTYTVYVTETNSNVGGFVGCESEPRAVSIRVSPLPESISFKDSSDLAASFKSNFCYDDEKYTIDAAAIIAGQTIPSVRQYLIDSASSSTYATYELIGGGYSGFFEDNGNGTASIYPSFGVDGGRLGDTTSHYIRLRFANAGGCEQVAVQKVTVYPHPNISFYVKTQFADDTLLSKSLDSSRFYISELAETVELVGYSFDANSLTGKGSFSGGGISPKADGIATFDPNAGSAKSTPYTAAETFNINFSVSGDNSCLNTITKQITVLPVPKFKNYDEGEPGPERYIRSIQACRDQDVIVEVSIDNLSSLGDPAGLTIDDLNFSWYARVQGAETDTLMLDNVAQNGYTIYSTKTDSTYQIRFANKYDEVAMTEGPNLDGVVNFTAAASYNFAAPHGTVVSRSNTSIEQITLGETPQPKIRWDSTTIGSQTIFYFSDNVGGEPELNDMEFKICDARDTSIVHYIEYRNIDSVEWDSDNLRDSLVLTKEKYELNAGKYFVSLQYNTTSACDAIETRYITINDYVSVDQGGEMLEDFESGNGGWYVNNIDFYSSKPGYDTIDVSDQSWELSSTTSFSGINSSVCWVTDADSSYLSQEESWVMSPTYNLSALALPTIGFTFASYMDPKDGVVLQYSTDDGIRWETLGAYTDEDGTTGKNWYNREGINGNPGNLDDIFLGNNIFNPQIYGWTFAGGRVDADDENEVKWRIAAHKLDLIGDGLKHIRFRFALGAGTGDKTDSNNDPYPGFAFDNFKLYDRQKLIVLEQFTSLANATSLTVTDELNYRVGSVLGNDALVINYFTSLVAEPDPLNLRSANASSARTLYYGIEQIPKSVIAGQIQQGSATATDATGIMGWNVNKFNEIALDESAFNIGDITIGGTDQQVTISTSFESKVDLPDSTEVSFRFAIVEDSIIGQDVNTTYGIDTIYSALRTMLPSSGGLTYVGPVSVGQTDFGLNFNLKWNISKVYDPNKLAVIVFVQLDTEVDEEAGLGRGIILQAKRVEVPDGKIVPDASNITAIKPPKGKEFSVYPNPSDRQFEIQINGYVADQMSWTLYDQTGREVSVGLIKKGQTKIIVDTNTLPSGLYMLRLFNRDILWDPKRVMILH